MGYDMSKLPPVPPCLFKRLEPQLGLDEAAGHRAVAVNRVLDVDPQCVCEVAGAAQAVEPPAGDAVDLATAHVRQQAAEAGPLHLRPGELVPIPDDDVVLALGPGPQVHLLALGVLALVADADVDACGHAANLDSGVQCK